MASTKTTLILMMLTLCAGCGGSSDPLGIAITNVTVIDAPSGVRENHTVIFDGDEIISVGPTTENVRAKQVLDGSGKFLIPGLWDMHVHLTYDDAFTDAMPRSFLSLFLCLNILRLSRNDAIRLYLYNIYSVCPL